MKQTEYPLAFSCQNQTLIGILHKPENRPSNSQSNMPGVLIVVGGPQYRAGSHRQFVLLARHLAAQGTAVLRFDCRGMGDSHGEQRSFEDIHDDIKAALSQFDQQIPEINRFVIWGLCDAASAAVFYAHTDKRIVGLVLLNPWVHTEAGEAKAYLKNYYVQRLKSREFWQKVMSGQFRLFSSFGSFSSMLRKSLGREKQSQDRSISDQSVSDGGALPDIMRDCLKRFTGQVLIILSGNNDYVSEEFKSLLKSSKSWQTLAAQPNVKLQYFDVANHTFSRNDWRQQVEVWTQEWVNEL